MGNKTTKDTTEENTMEEQNELNDLKKLMERQQKTLTETMSAMELKATALQEKLDRRAELSSANAEAGVKKIALEYKVVELKIEDVPLPPGFGEPKATSNVDPLKNKDEGADKQAIIKECEEKVLQKYREFEQTKLKELGEEGWTLRSHSLVFGSRFTPKYDTYLYYFSRPL
jgi:DNA repair exonuclease SbcCD ATPase subunit